MPMHQSLTLKKFYHAVSLDLLGQYFNQLTTTTKPVGWDFMNFDAFENFLNGLGNSEAKAAILEDFRRINDICCDSMTILLRTYKQFGLDYDEKAQAEELAMRLFVLHRQAFEFAWSRYLLFGTSSKLTHISLPCQELDIKYGNVSRFQDELKEWFKGQTKGICNVKHFEDAEGSIILISRGTYLRTYVYWKDERMSVASFRPASEDVLRYEPKTSQLTIKASLQKDRRKYLELFASCIAGDPSLVKAADHASVFSLGPIQEGKFSYLGSGAITRIELIKVRLKLQGESSATIEVSSGDVLRTLEEELTDLSLDSGRLTLAELRFHIHPENGKPVVVAYDIEPPAQTHLAQKRYAEIIERYLEDQKVKLR